jgi:hypothetical protein
MTRFTRIVAPTIFALFALALIFPTPESAQQDGPPADRPAQDDLHRADPCGLAPDAPGKAEGIDKRCDLGGSSGITKGDFNNDGIADLAVGVPDELRTSTCCFDPQTFSFRIVDHPGAGAVNIIYGTANGLTPTGNQTLALGELNNDDNNHYGKALAAGNFRGAGFASDLAVAVPRAKHNGAVVGAVAVHFSDGTKLRGNPNQTFFGDQFRGTGTVIGDFALLIPDNPSMTWGDFNGDGVGDLAIEVATCRTCTNPLPRSAVLVLYGNAGTGFSTSNFTVLVMDDGLSPNNFVNPPQGCFNPGGGGGHFCGKSRGHVALAAADLDNDSKFELLIGSPNCTEILDDGSNFTSGGAEGCVAIVRGRTGTLDPFFNWSVLTPPFDGVDKRGGFGAALAIGDFDDDGVKDVAVGAPDTRSTPVSSGAVRVFPDVRPGGTNAPAPFSFPSLLLTQSFPGLETAESNDRFGASLAANRFNGDLPFDLAIGAPGESTTTVANAGQVHIIYGVSGIGLSTGASTGHPAAQNFLGGGFNGVGGAFGSTLSAWNFGKTTEADLAIGIPLATFNLFNAAGTAVIATLQGAGQVLVVYGSSVNGLQNSGGLGAQLWSQSRLPNPGCTVCTDDPAKAGNHFGASIY